MPAHCIADEIGGWWARGPRLHNREDAPGRGWGYGSRVVPLEHEAVAKEGHACTRGRFCLLTSSSAIKDMAFSCSSGGNSTTGGMGSIPFGAPLSTPLEIHRWIRPASLKFLSRGFSERGSFLLRSFPQEMARGERCCGSGIRGIPARDSHDNRMASFGIAGGSLEPFRGNLDVPRPSK